MQTNPCREYSVGLLSRRSPHDKLSLHSVYEDRELQAAEKRAQERLEFDNQLMKIQTMLDFERSRDTAGHAEQINDEVAALEESLQKCQKNEKKYRKVSPH